MYIKKVKITNFKCFKDTVTIELNQHINIIVGNNEAGKTTVLEAIHLALTGRLNGKSLKNNLTEYVFNKDAVADYRKRVTSMPPAIRIELFFDDVPDGMYFGDTNSDRVMESGISYEIDVDDAYSAEVSQLSRNEFSAFPVEYYVVKRRAFSRAVISSYKQLDIQPVYIDSSKLGRDADSAANVASILKLALDEWDESSMRELYDRLKNSMKGSAELTDINRKLRERIYFQGKELGVTVDQSQKDDWLRLLRLLLEGLPIQYASSGEQCMLMTKIALAKAYASEVSLVNLIEEPENHLSPSKLNELLSDILENGGRASQIVISTHSSFVANKLNLRNLILLAGKRTLRLNDLPADTVRFFFSLAGYDTLRLILCKGAFLVEGDSDELVLQRAYWDENGCLPIQAGLEVISCRGLSFKRYLDIAKPLGLRVAVVTDNDGDLQKVRKKYEEYTGLENIKIFYHGEVLGPGTFGVDDAELSTSQKAFNYNTLEPMLLHANGQERLSSILGRKLPDSSASLLKYMQAHKTDVALKIFNHEGEVAFPRYIQAAIKHLSVVDDASAGKAAEDTMDEYPDAPF